MYWVLSVGPSESHPLCTQWVFSGSLPSSQGTRPWPPGPHCQGKSSVVEAKQKGPRISPGVPMPESRVCSREMTGQFTEYTHILPCTLAGSCHSVRTSCSGPESCAACPRFCLYPHTHTTWKPDPGNQTCYHPHPLLTCVEYLLPLARNS